MRLHLPISLSIITALVIDMACLEFSVIHWPQTSDSLVFQYEDYRYMSLCQFKFLFHKRSTGDLREAFSVLFQGSLAHKEYSVKIYWHCTSSWWSHYIQSSCVYQSSEIKLVQHVWLRDLALSFSTGKNSLS